MAHFKASRRTIPLNTDKWQEAMNNGMVNIKIDFTEDNWVGNIAILHEMKK